MRTETDRQSHRKGKRDSSLTDHLDANDFFPPGTGWNTGAATSPEPQRQAARPTQQPPIEPRQH